jgi:hypothetical protein
MSSANNEQLIELVSNAQMAFLNGKHRVLAYDVHLFGHA